MSIAAFQTACRNHKISTSFCITEADNIIPPGIKIKRMIIRFWVDNGKNFSFDLDQQNGSVVFDPEKGRITYPSEEQITKLDEKVRECVCNLLDCLKEEQIPIKQEKVFEILGYTTLFSESQRKKVAFLLS